DLARRQQYEGFEKFVAERDRLRDRQQTQRQWSVTGVRNAKAKKPDNDKHIVFRESQRSEKMASKVKATEKAIQRLDVVDKPWEPWELQLELKVASRAGDVVARLQGAVVELGSFRLGPVDLQVDWQDRLAILGPNGSGKTPLLRALIGEVDLAAGTRWLGPGVKVGLLDQSRSRYATDDPVLPAFMARTGLDRS